MTPTLTDVDLEVRIRALREVLKGEPGLSVAERAELVAEAVWPASVGVPEQAASAGCGSDAGAG